MIRTVGGYAIFVCALMLAASGISYRFAQPPAEEYLVEVVGPASDISESLIERRGRKYINFTVDGKHYSCGNKTSNFPRLVEAVNSGQPLSIGVDPNGSKALIGGMTKYFRIRQGDEVLASYDTMCEQFHEGRFAVLVASIGVALCMCVPAFQLTFGRLSARRSKASTRTPARLDSATSDTSFSGQAGACPSCDAELSEGAVLCISCGYHLQKGTRLETRAKLAKSQKRGNVLGILNSGNAIAIFTATGLALGVTTALVGGTLYGTGQLFEIGIYTFVGLVLGTVIGGGVGYALTPILPDASHEVASEQLVGGLISIVGGFMAIGIAILAFNVFQDIESGSQSAARLPGIVVGLYELAGKWLTAIIVSGVGLVMVAGGVRVLLPSKAR